MNQRYRNNDRGREYRDDDPRQGSGRTYHYSGRDWQPGEHYEGDWGGQSGRYGHAGSRDQPYESEGWNEPNPRVLSQDYRRGRYRPEGPAYAGPREPDDQFEYFRGQWSASGPGGQQGYSRQDPGGRGDFADADYRQRGYRQDEEEYSAWPPYREGGRGTELRAYGTHRSPDFSGIGPKGYQRSDERLREDVCERLTDDREIDASDLSVRCQDGVVTLEGSVSERRLKHRAEDLVERCHGVKDIENRISVKRGGSRDNPEGGDSGGNRGRKKH